MSIFDKLKNLFSRNKQKLLTDGNEATETNIEGGNSKKKNKFKERIKESAKEDFTNFEGLTEEQRYEKILRALGVVSAFINHFRSKEYLFNELSNYASDDIINNSSKRSSTEICLATIDSIKTKATISPFEIILPLRNDDFKSYQFTTSSDGTVSISEITSFDGYFVKDTHVYNNLGIEIGKSLYKKIQGMPGTPGTCINGSIVRQGFDSAILTSSQRHEKVIVDLLSINNIYKNLSSENMLQYDIADLPDTDPYYYKGTPSIEDNWIVKDTFNHEESQEERKAKLKEAISKSKYPNVCEKFLEENENTK